VFAHRAFLQGSSEAFDREKQGSGMNTVSKVLLAGALAFSFAAPVMAAENEDSVGMVYEFVNGKMYKAHVTGEAMHAMMSHFKRIKNGTLIYSEGGNLYLAEDAKMHDGRMMSAMLFGEDIGAGRER
jgi:hypothetical protein